MALAIKRESTRLESIKPENEISSLTSTTSHAETSGPQGTSQNQQPANIEKQNKAAKDLAISKKFDGQLQANSLKLQLKDQTAPSAYTQGSNTQLLGKSGDAVLQSYAVQKDATSKAEQSNSSGSIRNESAGDTRVAAEQDKKDAARVAEAQKIIDAARTYGRRIETRNAELPNLVNVTEFVPGEWTENIGDMKVFTRVGVELTDGDVTIRRMTYYDSGKLQSVGYVESIIEDRKETITKVTGEIGLKVGDTRDVPDPITSAAGKVPSTYDPQPDGRYGSAGKSNNNSNGSGGDAKAENSSPNSAGGPHEKHYSDTGTWGSAGTPESNSGGTVTSTPKEHVYHSEDSGKTFEDKGVQWTEYPPTEVEVIAPEEQKTDSDGSHRAPYGDYADSPEIPTKAGPVGSERSEVSTGSRVQHPWNPESSLIKTTYPEGPMDFGDPNDPNASQIGPDLSMLSSHIGPDPVTDPANPGEDGGEFASLEVGSISMDMRGTLRDGVNPMDPKANGGPAPNRPKTSDAERHTSNDDDR